MLKLLTLIGARPQIIKASALSRAIRLNFASQISEVLVHTGQHYDENMSSVFFEELEIPKPHYNLMIGSGKHGDQTAKMIAGIEPIIEKENPDYIILYGDTNSTLAGAIAASKMQMPIAHIEAGLRSYNKKMPEEINRILSDHTSTYLFPPTQTGVDNLRREGLLTNNLPPYTMDNPGVFNVGDVMYDNSLYFSGLTTYQVDILERLQLKSGAYVLVTLHRNTNTDEGDRLNAIVDVLLCIAATYSIKLVLPLHPRTAKQMNLMLIKSLYKAVHENSNIMLIPPVSFLEMIHLEQNAKLIITDSGGVQKEAYFYKKPCIILRAETEWIEIVESGAARLCDANPDRIFEAYNHFEQGDPILFTPIYGNGRAAEQILKVLLEGIDY